MIDAGRLADSGRFDRGLGPLTTSRSSALVRVRNGTGADLDRFAVVGLSAPVFEPSDSEDAYLREVAFAAVTPDGTDHLGKFAVLFEPAPADRVVRAWVAGVTQARLNVLDDGHDYADVSDGTCDYLDSTAYGSAQVIWREGTGGGYGYGYGTGEQWAIVRLGASPVALGLAKVTTEIAKATSATALGKGKIQRYTKLSSAGNLSALTGLDEDCYSFNRDKKLAANSTIPVGRLVGRWVALNIDACANLL